MNEVLNSIKYKNYEIIVKLSDSSELLMEIMNPRYYSENLSKMYCAHKNYILGDESINELIDSTSFSSWENIHKELNKLHNIAIIKKLSMTDHGNLHIYTGNGNCRFDSGQIGFVFITKESLRKEFNCKRITKKLLEKADSILEGEVKEYSYYVSGEIYSVDVTDSNGDYVENIGNIVLGLDSCAELIEDIKKQLDYLDNTNLN